jgi:AraC-like DNA-binding protein
MLFPSQPAPQLASFVQGYVQVRASFHQAMPFWPIPARSFDCIEFTFGTPYEIHYLNGCTVETTRSSMLIGAKTYQRIRLQLQGSVETFAVLFQPTGLQRLFSLPGAKILNEHYEADAVLGPAIRSLRSRLADAKSLPERVQTADQYFTTRLASSQSRSEVTRAAQEIQSKLGCVRVQDLACCTGWSLRHFERRFSAELGVTPKLYARIVRFEAAMERRMTSPRATWTDIAHELQYHDHMHMVHDFQLLAGESPSSLVIQLEDLVSAATVSH